MTASLASGLQTGALAWRGLERTFKHDPIHAMDRDSKGKQPWKKRRERHDFCSILLLVAFVVSSWVSLRSLRKSLASMALVAEDSRREIGFEVGDAKRSESSVGEILVDQHLDGVKRTESREMGVLRARNMSTEPNFDAAIHASYRSLPPLAKASDDVLHGGWKLSQKAYDFAAYHPAADVISWDSPRLIRFPSFLTPSEIDHLIGMAYKNLKRSRVISSGENEKEEINDVRTSFGAWPGKDKVVAAIYDRIHRLIGIPEPLGEASYILNYKINQRYDAHNDNCMDNLAASRKADDACKAFLARAGGPRCGPGYGGDACGDRIATFIMFLKTPKTGGTTAFPNAKITMDGLQRAGKTDVMTDQMWYCSHEEVLSLSPTSGDAILFWDYKPCNGTGTGSYEDGSADPSAVPVVESLHSGCPVLDGEKWIATRWIRSAMFV